MIGSAILLTAAILICGQNPAPIVKGSELAPPGQASTQAPAPAPQNQVPLPPAQQPEQSQSQPPQSQPLLTPQPTTPAVQPESPPATDTPGERQANERTRPGRRVAAFWFLD